MNSKNILFLGLIDYFDTSSGISKKVVGQVEALEEYGANVFVTSIDTSKRQLSILNKRKEIESIKSPIITNFTISILYLFVLLPKFIYKRKIDIIYVRYNRFIDYLVFYLKQIFKKLTILYEIPTYPMLKEILATKSIIKITDYILGRILLNKAVDRIITYSTHFRIIGKQTIRISNGYNTTGCYNNYNYIIREKKHDKIIFTVVADLRFWHGVDRFLYSLKKYGKDNILFNIVGNGAEYTNLKKIVDSDIYLKSIVIFHGQKSGKDLYAIYNNTDIAVASLACHRKGLYLTSELKIREYLSIGLPFIYSTEDSIITSDLPFVYKVSSNEELIDIKAIINWYKTLQCSPQQIQLYAIKNLSWYKQMKPVIDYIERSN